MILLWGLGGALLALSYYYSLFWLPWLILSAMFYTFYSWENFKSKQLLTALLLFFIVHNSWVLSLAPWSGRIVICFVYLISIGLLSFIYFFLLKSIYKLTHKKFGWIGILAITLFIEIALLSGSFAYPLYSLTLTQVYSPFIWLTRLPFGYFILPVVLVTFCLIIATNFLSYQNNKDKKKKYFFRFIAIFGGLALLVLLAQPPKKIEPNLNAVLIQTNINQQNKLDSNQYPQLLNTYKDILKKALANYPDAQHYLLPETIIPALWQKRIAKKLSAISGDKTIIFGLPVKKNKKIHNSILVLKNGKYTASYHKKKLVPFGEYMPAGINLLYRDKSVIYYSPDSNANQVNLNGTNLSVGICFESAFPQLFQNQTETKAILILSNDAWYNNMFKKIHLKTAVIRAVESQKKLYFISNNGITAIVNNRGKIIQSLTAGKQGFLKD